MHAKSSGWVMRVKRIVQRDGNLSLWRSPRAYLLILPSLGLFMFFFLYPILFSLYLSTTNASFFNFARGYHSVGLGHYRKLILEGEFLKPLSRTILFMVTSVTLKVVAGLLLAALFSSRYLKFKRILQPLFLAPWAVPWFFLAMIWRGMFNQDFGVINQVLHSIGLSAINWLNDTSNAFISFNIVEVYLVYPFMMTVILAAIQSIPKEIHEAAMMDGARSWQRFTYITIPLIRKPLSWATLITAIASYMIFGVPFLLNKGGPAGTNEFLLVFGYKRAFDLGRYGFAAAFMVLVFIILVVIVVLFSRVTRLTEEVR